MTRIKNHTRGPRVFNIKTGDDVGQVVVGPGQTSDEVDLVNPDDPVVKGMHEAGEISLDGHRARALQESDQIAKAREDHDKSLHELRQKERELAEREAELKSQQDQFQRMQREAAMEAGRRLADPLPPGTDTKGGKESQEALRRMGLGQNEPPQGEPPPRQQRLGQPQDEAKSARK